MKNMQDVTGALKRLLGAKDAAQELHAAHSANRAEWDGLDREEKRVLGLPVPVEDHPTAIGAEVDRIGAIYTSQARDALRHSLGRMETDGRTGQVRAIEPKLPDPMIGFATIPFLCAALPDEMKRGFARIAGGDFDAGPPLSRRLEVVKSIRARKAEIEREDSELVDRAGELGIMLELLPVVEEARRLERVRAAQQHRDHELHERVNAKGIRQAKQREEEAERTRARRAQLQAEQAERDAKATEEAGS